MEGSLHLGVHGASGLHVQASIAQIGKRWRSQGCAAASLNHAGWLLLSRRHPSLTSRRRKQMLNIDLLSWMQPRPVACTADDAVDVYCHGPGWWQGCVHQIWEGRLMVHYPGKQLQCSALDSGVTSKVSLLLVKRCLIVVAPVLVQSALMGVCGSRQGILLRDCALSCVHWQTSLML